MSRFDLAPGAMRPPWNDATSSESEHFVQFYDADGFLVDALTRYIGTAVGTGDAGIVIATAPHRDRLTEALVARGLDVAAIRRQGRYVTLDANETLSQFMVDGWPDERRFVDVVGSVVARVAATERHPRVRAFGEMVALLYTNGTPEAAIRLEELWSDLGKRRRFSLLCMYPIAAFREQADGDAFRTICGAHSHVIPAESYMALGTPDERLRAVTQLQQKASALKTETAGRQEAERMLQHRNQMLQALVEASPVPIVVIDPDTKVRLWNPAAERLFGWSADEIVGRPMPIVSPETLGECAWVRDAVGRGETVVGVQTHHTRRDGTVVDVIVSAAPLSHRDGAMRAIVLLFEDVTERKRAEVENARLYEAERQARDAAEAANHAKDEFLAMLGHELRNPLSTVRNAVVTARLDPSRRDRALDIACRGADQLGRLVDDLLDVARITQGRITLRREPLSFCLAVAHAIEAARQHIEQRAHAITVSLPGSDPQVHGDAARLEQVIGNLLSNAAKYMDPGGRITVTVEHTAGEAVLRVRDTGMGIAAEILPRVFDLFAQADQSLERAEGGLGIGLTLVKRLVEMHGGRVEAHSDGIGRGAEFIVRLPAVHAVQQQAHASVTPRGENRANVQVLVVEDNADAAESMTMLLELLGHRVRAVGDGRSAVEAARANPPDVMVVDIGLPGIDGYQVAQQIRQDDALRHIVLVALTGYGGEEDRQRALVAGFDYHLVKPVDVDNFQALVTRLAVQAKASILRSAHP